MHELRQDSIDFVRLEIVQHVDEQIAHGRPLLLVDVVQQREHIDATVQQRLHIERLQHANTSRASSSSSSSSPATTTPIGEQMRWLGVDQVVCSLDCTTPLLCTPAARVCRVAVNSPSAFTAR